MKVSEFISDSKVQGGVTLLASVLFHPWLITGIVKAPEALEINIIPPILY
jgi:hypothetical protein